MQFAKTQLFTCLNNLQFPFGKFGIYNAKLIGILNTNWYCNWYLQYQTNKITTFSPQEYPFHSSLLLNACKLSLVPQKAIYTAVYF